MSRDKRRKGAIVVVFVLGAAAALTLRELASAYLDAGRVRSVASVQEPAQTPQTSGDAVAETAAPDMDMAPSPPAATNLSLDSPGAPSKLSDIESLGASSTPDLAGRYADLAASARAGDAQAAHRLGVELNRCQYYQERIDELNSRTHPGNMELRNPAMRDAIFDDAERKLRDLRPLEEKCVGVTPAQAAEAIDWFEMAANRGDLESAIGYYMQGVGNLAELATRPDELMRFRATASRFLHLAAQRCNPEATYALAMSFRYGTTTQVDLSRAYAFWLMSRWQSGGDPLIPGGPETIRPSLSELQFSQAVDFAHRYYRRYCL